MKFCEYRSRTIPNTVRCGYLLTLFAPFKASTMNYNNNVDSIIKINVTVGKDLVEQNTLNNRQCYRILNLNQAFCSPVL